jgi:gliding motility-associated-like protein
VIVIGINTANGEAIPGAPSAAAVSASALSASSADKLSIYWNNGVTWIKVGGTVDPVRQTISIKSSFLGSYQVRTTAAASSLNLEQANVFPRLFTPNGDGFNDHVYFILENPNSVDVHGEIFDLMGRHVATLPAPVGNTGIGTTMTWDGKDSKGSVVPSGAYYYKIQGEGKTFTGTVGVAR